MSEGEEEMKWMIASDIHGSAAYLEKLLEAYKQEKADRMLLLGDLLYHGPRNDLPEGYQPKRVIEVDQMVLEFPVMAEYAILTAGTRMIFATHGHVFNEKNLPPLHKGDILLHGHTHVPKCVAHENYIYMNPGSVSIPKENSYHGYMTWEGSDFVWKDLEGGVRNEVIV